MSTPQPGLLTLSQIAERLDEAARQARAIPQLNEPLTLDQAYQIQALSMARRYERGERRVGVKMGFTSLAKMAQMGVGDMIWGRLTDAMRIAPGALIRRASYVHPRAEPEIAFLLQSSIDAEASIEEARAAVEAVAPAIEIIDSRFENFKFSVTDVVADNSSSSGFVVGPWASPHNDIGDLGMVLIADGERRETGSSHAIMGDPWRSLLAAIRLASAAGEPLGEGDIVMAGGATAAISLAQVRHVQLQVDRLGDTAFYVED